MAKILKGLLHKKVKGSNGEKNTVPFLPKTLAKLVIREDGTSVEDALNEVSGGKSYATFESKEEYDIAREAGEVKEGTIVIIPRNDTDNTEEPVTPPVGENPSDIEEPSGGADNGDETPPENNNTEVPKDTPSEEDNNLNNTETQNENTSESTGETDSNL